MILGTSGDDLARDACMVAGADGFLTKPSHSLAEFQELILSCLPEEQRPMGPRIINDEEISPDAIAYRDDLAHAAELLCDGTNDKLLDYVAQFVTGIARTADDGALITAGEALTISRMRGKPCHSDIARLAGLVQERLKQPEPV